MSQIWRYVGQQPTVVQVWEPFVKDDGSGQGFSCGYHLDRKIADLEVCDDVRRHYGIQFPDGEVFLLGHEESIKISTKKKEILEKAKKLLTDSLQDVVDKLDSLSQDS